MTARAPVNIPTGISYAEAEAIARQMSDLDLIRVARNLAFADGNQAEMAASLEVSRRFEQLQQRALSLHHSLEVLSAQHEALEHRFETLVVALQRALALLVGWEEVPANLAS